MSDTPAYSFTFSDSGWLHEPVIRCESTHCDERPDRNDVSALVIHNISLPPKQFGGGYIEQFFTGVLPEAEHPYFTEISELRVSAHCLISREGQVTQFVPFSKRAWHAGQSILDGREKCNDFSIGIELEGSDDIEYQVGQYQVLANLTVSLLKTYPLLTMDRIVGHSDISPGRKNRSRPIVLIGSVIENLLNKS